MTDTAKKSSAQSLWRNRNFLLLWSGQFVSWTGTEISGIALPLLVLALTGSPAQAGFIAGIRGVVYVVWAIPAGVLIDRWDRRTVMVIATWPGIGRHHLSNNWCNEFISSRRPLLSHPSSSPATA